MTFPLGSLRAEGGGAGGTYTRKSAAQDQGRRTGGRARAALAPPAAAGGRCRAVAAGLAGAGHAPRRRPRVSPPRATARRCTTRPAWSAPGCRTWACSCSAIRCGGWCRWACVPGCRALARSARGADAAPTRCRAPPSGSGWRLLLAASCALEWTRLYRWEPLLPGACRRRARLHARAVVDAVAGLCRLGRAVDRRAGGRPVAGAALFLAARWPSASASGSTRCASAAQQRLDQAEDRRIGEKALREREIEVEVERQDVEDHVPLVIEPTLLEVPKTERVAKERQKPLFVELADTKLPQVDLLDAGAGARRERDARVAGDDQAADREEAQGLRRRGARGGGRRPAR